MPRTRKESTVTERIKTEKIERRTKRVKERTKTKTRKGKGGTVEAKIRIRRERKGRTRTRTKRKKRRREAAGIEKEAISLQDRRTGKEIETRRRKRKTLLNRNPPVVDTEIGREKRMLNLPNLHTTARSTESVTKTKKRKRTKIRKKTRKERKGMERSLLVVKKRNPKAKKRKRRRKR